MLHRPARELLASITLTEFNAYLKLMLDRDRDQDEAETQARRDEEPELDLAAMSDHEVAAVFGARVRR